MESNWEVDGCTYRSEHQTPVKTLDMRLVRDLVEGKIRNISQHDTKGGPHLPHHDEGTADRRRGTLRGVDGDSGGLGANA